MTDPSKTKKDPWDKADIIAKILIPLTALGVTLLFNNGRASQKTFEVAIQVLQSSNSDKLPSVRKWAIDVFQKYTSMPFEDKALKELEKNPLPSGGIPRIVFPNPEQLRRISIIRPITEPIALSQKIKKALSADEKYKNVNITMDTRPANQFPNSADTRFYYTADRANAQALNDYIKSKLEINSKLNDRSTHPDAYKHIQGELHVYI
jgi:hypothetical protein